MTSARFFSSAASSSSPVSAQWPGSRRQRAILRTPPRGPKEDAGTAAMRRRTDTIICRRETTTPQLRRPARQPKLAARRSAP